MNNWTIAKRLIIGFSISLVVACATGGLAVIELLEIRRDTAVITSDVLPGTALITQAESLVKDNNTLLLQHIIAANVDAMKEIEEQIAENDRALDGVLKEYAGTISRDHDKELFAAIGPALAELRQARRDDVYPPSDALKTNDARTAFEEKYAPLYDALAKATHASVEDDKQEGARAGQNIARAVGSALTGLFVALVLMVAFGGGTATAIIRSVNAVLRGSVGVLRISAEQVVAASGQVSTASQSLSQGATEQAASLEQTSASLQEMSSMTRRNAENSARAAELMVDAAHVVHEANGSLDTMVASMREITESSDRISKIIKTIDEIAFQTNILALNAAVEAARAGDAGMGFAVVADEVRSLAQRSAQAAKDTAGLIEASIANAHRGGQRLQQVAASMAAITGSAANVKELVDQISIAGQQQAQGIDQVAQAVSEMEKVTQTTAASAEESAAASEELNAQASATMDIVRNLAALAGGTRDQGRNPAVRIGRRHSASSSHRRPETPSLTDTGTFARF